MRHACAATASFISPFAAFVSPRAAFAAAVTLRKRRTACKSRHWDWSSTQAATLCAFHTERRRQAV